MEATKYGFRQQVVLLTFILRSAGFNPKHFGLQNATHYVLNKLGYTRPR